MMVINVKVGLPRKFDPLNGTKLFLWQLVTQIVTLCDMILIDSYVFL